MPTHQTTTQSKGHGDENFPVASRLLPAWSRPHVMTFYAFARAADDIADAPHLSAEDKLNQLRALDAQVLAGEGALAQSLRDTEVSPRHAHDLLKAFMWDAQHPRTNDWAALMAYCQLSAAPVGRYLIDLLGGCDDDYRASDALCAALQILNHIQDIRADAVTMDRVYVPADWMADAGVLVEDLKQAKSTPALSAVRQQMLSKVDALLVLAQPASRVIRSRALAREAAGILAIAKALSRALKTNDPLMHRVELSKPEMALRFIWGALRA
ncbi:squalene/phytoene synthase family protein [Magnetovibrio sp. PR-2]|uniref:squalene/phytoene synthase family protein n=1 Tax=Magnetovibrio sp. PR-2 TaxID=3120356 RepID=UPI002FCE0300